mgnify:CR=1 FL=1
MSETKKMRYDTFKCSELASFLQKNQYLSDKMQKTVNSVQLSTKCNKYEFFALFLHKNLIFCKNEASSEHLNVSCRIFFVSDIF